MTGAAAVKIAPSLLAADFSRLAEEVRAVEAAGADWLHLDVMDGHFVPNLTIGPVIVGAIRKVTQLPLDVHLMIDDPLQYLAPFADAGADHVTVHIESPAVAAAGLESVLKQIRRRKLTAGVSIKPATPAEPLQSLLAAVDLVLVMTVEPGFGGQSFLPEMVPKVRWLRERFVGEIAVDGGLDAHTAPGCIAAGASVIVAGTSIFRADDYRAAIKQLRHGWDGQEPTTWPADTAVY